MTDHSMPSGAGFDATARRPKPTIADAPIEVALPVRRISSADLVEALRKGWADFMAKPSHILFLGVIYPVVAVLLMQYSIQSNLLPLFFPLLAGFAIIGPFAGIGLYEISRRREIGEEPTWRDAIRVTERLSFRSILGLGVLLMLVFVAWLFAAAGIYYALFPEGVPPTLTAFLGQILTTGRGWALIVIGHAVGFVFALAAFALSVVSFPLLVDRHVRTAAAIRTSIEAVRVNPRVMAIWAAIIAGALMLGSALLFAGLAVAIPVLAHASWHLYRRVVG
jgi:uncharacterized membrane protein